MRRITKVAAITATALTALIATAGSASAATTTSPDPACVPVTEKAAVAEVNHTEYKYKPAGGTGHIQWSCDNVPTMTRRRDLHRDGVKTQIVIDSPAVAAVDGVNCEIPFPANPLKGIKGISPTMTVPIRQARRSTPSRRWSTTSR